MNQGIQTSAIKIIGQNERGITSEIDLSQAKTCLLIYRKADTISGRHYHKGLSATKNPETLILCQGRARLRWHIIDQSENNEMSIEGPIKIEIAAGTWHELEAETDCFFIEQNSIEEHQVDTFYNE